jgi:hypothetical protein
MKIPLSYSDQPPPEMPGENLLAVTTPHSLNPPKPLDRGAEGALEPPIGSPRKVAVLLQGGNVLPLVAGSGPNS